MRHIITHVQDGIREGRALAYCRLVETRGSTPQKAGAAMVVMQDGTQHGTLGGGCVEAEVKRQALKAIQDRAPRISTFHLDHDYGWDDGLVCGGRMNVLVFPVVDRQPMRYFEANRALIESTQGGTEAVVFDGDRAGWEAASCFLFDAACRLVASHPEEAAGRGDITLLAARLPPLHARPRPSAAGGVAFLPILPRCRLVIVGGGHVGKAVAELASRLEFDVCVADDRAEYVTQERFPTAEARLCGNLDRLLDNLEITPLTYCLIVTRGHHHDQQALRRLIGRGAGYIGLIGSRRKIRQIFDNLLAEGVAADQLRAVHAPVGIDIGSQTVEEIAVSIGAELVAYRNLQGNVPGRPRAVFWDA